MSKLNKVCRKFFIEEAIFGMSELVKTIENCRGVSTEDLFEKYITTTKGVILSNLDGYDKGQIIIIEKMCDILTYGIVSAEVTECTQTLLELVPKIKKVFTKEEYFKMCKRVFKVNTPEEDLEGLKYQIIAFIMFIGSFAFSNKSIKYIGDDNKPIYFNNFYLNGVALNSDVNAVAYLYYILSKAGLRKQVSPGGPEMPLIKEYAIKQIDKEIGSNNKLVLEYSNRIKNDAEFTIVLGNIKSRLVSRFICSLYNNDYTGARSDNNNNLERYFNMGTTILEDTEHNLLDTSKVISGLYNSLINLDRKDILTLRSFIIPKNGLIYRFTSADRAVEIRSIEVHEVHDEELDTHIIRYFIDTRRGDTIEGVLNILNIEGVINLSPKYQLEVFGVILILDKLGLTDEIFKRNLGSEELVEATRVSVNKLIGAYSDYRIDTPKHWNYKGKDWNKGTSSVKGNTVEVERLIERFTRKLPEGQEPSEEAKRIAEKYRISLEDGKTIVDTHSRKVRVKI